MHLPRERQSKPQAKTSVFVVVYASATGKPSETSAPTCIENRRARLRISSEPTLASTILLTRPITRKEDLPHTSTTGYAMVPRAPTTPRTRRRHHRYLAVAALVLGATFALSGCAQIRAYDLQQLGSIGDIDIVLDGCGSEAGNPDCGLGNSGLASNATGTGQVLLGFEIDARFVPPATFATDGRLGGHQPFTASPSYTAELTRLDPPGPGLKWAGYISDARTYTPGKLVGARVPITRPLLPDGSPNGSTVFVSWRIGSRGVLADAPATRPVTCGDSLTAILQSDLTICSDESGSVGVFDFNDFGFLTPAPVTVQPGQTAVIPVTGKLTGPARPAINFALRATTTVPGATAVTNVCDARTSG